MTSNWQQTVRIVVAFLTLGGLPGASLSQASEQSAPQRIAEMTKIRLTIEGTEIIATLEENSTTSDFVSLLPMTLLLEDYNNTEKVSDLPRRLSTERAPEGIEPQVGDITYYAPWGNLACFTGISAMRVGSYGWVGLNPGWTF